MTVERMTEAHLDGVAELEELCFGEPWSRESLRLLLTDQAIGFVCVMNGRVAAYGGMLLALDEGQITNVAVHPEFRRIGLGKKIVDALIGEARQRALTQIALEVRCSNEAAISLYERAGFTRAGVRKRFYRNPTEDAFVMLVSV